MPIYEYTCRDCNESFTVLHLSSAAEKDTVCPKCGSGDIKKIPSSFSSACPIGSGHSSGGSSSGFTGSG